MKLHNDKENFEIAVRLASRYFNVSQAIVEKDYYVTLLLEELCKVLPNLVFKGGTSLSKCYKIIDRFSEDIDITLEQNSITQGNKKKVKKSVVDICKQLEFELLNIEETRSRRDYNCYRIDYGALYESSSLKPQLLLETVFMVKSYPIEVKSASSMIYDYFKITENEKAISRYELKPFPIKVQKLERTLIDKIFAICDYMIGNNINGHSRHIYDISRLLDNIKLDDNFALLINEVREDRKKNTKCYSAQDGIVISKLLKTIIDSNIYKEDYETITSKLISKPIKYEEAIESLKTIIESKIFERNK